MIRDLAFFTIIFFSVSFAMVAIYIGIDNINTAFQAEPGLPAKGVKVFDEFATNSPTGMDYFLATAFFGVFTLMLFLVWVLDVNPVFMFLLIIVLFVIALVAGFLANAWWDVAQDTTLGPAMSGLPITNFIINNYLVVTGLLGFVLLIVFVAKPGGGQA